MARKKNTPNQETGDDTQKTPLKGFDIKINEFGEIISSMPIERLNEFLNEETEDKKLKSQRPTAKDSEEG